MIPSFTAFACQGQFSCLHIILSNRCLKILELAYYDLLHGLDGLGDDQLDCPAHASSVPYRLFGWSRQPPQLIP